MPLRRMRARTVIPLQSSGSTDMSEQVPTRFRSLETWLITPFESPQTRLTKFLEPVTGPKARSTALTDTRVHSIRTHRPSLVSLPSHFREELWYT
jgi:hypothetical protein